MGRRKKNQNQEIAARISDEPLKELLSAIKKDDLKLFSEMVSQTKGYLSLCFGRLPLLSLCYLYGSARIAAAYEKSLLNFSAYVYVDEDYDAYRLFRKHAKRCLRFYIFEKVPVSPLEMLAIMGESSYLAKKYGEAQRDGRTVSRIRDIYRMLHAQQITIGPDGIAVKRKPLSRAQKIRLIVAVSTAVVIMALSGGAWIGFYALTGRGTAESPYKVGGEIQLRAALDKNAHIELSKDISLTSEWLAKDFGGSINGNGHTVYAGNKIPNGFISELSGKIENVSFVFDNLDMKITQNTALLIQTNSGMIDNVKVKAVGKFVAEAQAGEDEESNPIYLSLMAHENKGEINGCGVDAKVRVTGIGGHDTFLSCIAALNSGIIKGCYTVAGSTLDTDTVHVTGLVAKNEQGATVSGCANNAAISQTTANVSWLPNVSGVVLHNLGTVLDCINNGRLSAVSKASEKTLSVYVGGIACFNYFKITKSKNNADISAHAENYYIYIGGVAAFNDSAAVVIDNSCSYGKFSLSSTSVEGVFLFAGGISGYHSGMVKNSYSAATYATVNTGVFLGGIIGVAEYYTASSENNYYVGQANVTYGVATVLVGGTLYQGTDSGITKTATIDEIRAIEGVYWA